VGAIMWAISIFQSIPKFKLSKRIECKRCCFSIQAPVSKRTISASSGYSVGCYLRLAVIAVAVCRLLNPGQAAHQWGYLAGDAASTSMWRSKPGVLPGNAPATHPHRYSALHHCASTPRRAMLVMKVSIKLISWRLSKHRKLYLWLRGNHIHFHTCKSNHCHTARFRVTFEKR